MKRGRRKGGSKDKVFGCDLQEHLAATNQEIPQVLRSCSEFIEEYGIVDGIYRLSGVSSNTQKLRSEFDNEGTPDLYKDVYLQDIHCVSSLCKAYFRELPNPLLTYQLYDCFAEAVAVQLEDERLVKIKEVLEKLPSPHYKTLEYLMRHLVKMSTFSDQTNMHARNLAIVWAPNLLRSKDIEASGFNGTAAFMEVRIQSIVVEFILTHVPQLFPDLGLTLERRKSLPSPSALSGHEDMFFKAIPFQLPGNLSPGDGPPQMRPYHAIIDGTDKRKGSLKGRKWKSIFNLGGRLQDPRKKNKYTTKEKEKTSLRPAKSMDSLSSGPYTLEDSRHPSSHLSPLVTPSGTPESGTVNSGGVGSGYAVTYRRTGGASVSMVSGGSGTQGTYKSLDTGSTAGADRSPATLHGAASKAERRAGMHISGPFCVTVPLHITSGLALGVLHGGRAEEELPQHGVTEEEQPKKVKPENTGEKEQSAEGEKEKTDQKTECNQQDHAKDEVKMDNNENSPSEEEDKNEVKTEVEEAGLEEREEFQDEVDDYLSEEAESSETHHTNRPSLAEDPVESDYMDMKPGLLKGSAAAVGQSEMTRHPLSIEEEYPDQELPLDFQDTFGFLDLMDTSAPSQLNEFSVEPPCFEEEEEEDDDYNQNQPPCPTQSHLDEEKLSVSCTEFPARTNRAQSGKSHSLPYKSCPFLPVPSSSSDEDNYTEPDDDDEDESDKSEYEDMFCKSLPSACHFQGLNWTCPQTVTSNSADCSVDSHSNNQSECLHQTNNIEVTERSQDLTPVNQSESLTQTDTEMTPSNGMDTHAIEQCLNQGDLSPLPLETLDNLSVDEKKTEDKSTEDVKEESGSQEAGHISEPVQETNKEMGSTDNKEETHTCGQEERHSMDSEDEEDTYFGPDVTSISSEPSSIETSYTNDQLPVKEEHSSTGSQQAGSEGCHDIVASEVTLIDEPDLARESASSGSQDTVETTELSMEQKFTLHNDKQDQVEVGDKQSGTREVDKEGEEGTDKISVVGENVMKEEITEIPESMGENRDEESSPINEENKSESEQVNPVEAACEINKESKQEPERVTDEQLDKSENKDVEDDATHEVAEDLLKKEVEAVGEGQTVLERNEEDVEKLTIGKEKEGRDRGEESDGQKEKDNIGEETEARKDSHPEWVTEIKEGSVPEKQVVREMSEGEDRLSDDSGDSRDSGDLLEECESERENERAKEETNAEASMAGGKKPLRPPRMKELEGGKGVRLGPGVGRTVLISKQSPTRVYQVRAVPVVPPKPQHSKITAFKQQFQQKDSERQPREAEQGDLRQNHNQGNGTDEQKVEENQAKLKDTSGETCPILVWEPGKGEDKEGQGERRGTWDGGSWRKDGQKELDRETKRASGISICFDEAVARATGKRCREKEDRFIDLQWERGDQKEGSIQRKREEEGKTD
ncbi:rho GTPase-activating protein 30 isoform X2 [Colossoma macropomum]|uniref:rho GTPase-activating protein 30 isoform X2 n=1 Tax=Colossoma macropomum TaxID=42526 RepID=UPI001864B345|nr:rho GTPase-activating protein 30 isoform X2 [Colossoma macropomum]